MVSRKTDKLQENRGVLLTFWQRILYRMRKGRDNIDPSENFKSMRTVYKI